MVDVGQSLSAGMEPVAQSKLLGSYSSRQMSNVKRRKPWVAFLLSFLAPGAALGQLYNRQVGKFLGVCFVFNVFSLLVLPFLLTSPKGAACWIVAALVTWTLVWLDATISAYRIETTELAWYNKWYVYALVWIASLTIKSVSANYVKQNHFEAFKLPSSSMEPTLLPGDHLLVQKFAPTSATLRHGQVVLYTLADDSTTPDVDESEIHIVKRLVALPGDKIEVRGDKLLLNGIPQVEPYAIWLLGGRRDFGPAVVPENSVFLLGDNRDYSKDSRFYSDPFVSQERLEGIALYVYWSAFSPLDRFGKIIQ
ncbi:MAG: signal peptidase I [Bdellovibrionales bacterium]|nr:signal peptidase I [Bdellovibrionales bacterium]